MLNQLVLSSTYFQYFVLSLGLAWELPWRDFLLPWGEKPPMHSSLGIWRGVRHLYPQQRKLTELQAEAGLGSESRLLWEILDFLWLQNADKSGVLRVDWQAWRRYHLVCLKVQVWVPASQIYPNFLKNKESIGKRLLPSILRYPKHT